MIRTQVYIPEDIYRELTLLAQTKKVNYSHLIRKGVALVLQQEHKTKRNLKGWDKFIGAYKGKIKTNAVKDIHDYYRNGIV